MRRPPILCSRLYSTRRRSAYTSARWQLDPRSVAAQSWLAVTLRSRVINQLTDADATDIARAEGLVEQALAVSPRSTTAHFARGEVLSAQRRYSEGIHEHETMLAFDRTSVSALVALGHCKLRLQAETGSTEQVILLMEQASALIHRIPKLP